jgi:hypothetical protein
MEVARLRAMQEKQADHQSEQDELRARRYQVRGAGWWAVYAAHAIAAQNL